MHLTTWLIGKIVIGELKSRSTVCFDKFNRALLPRYHGIRLLPWSKQVASINRQDHKLKEYKVKQGNADIKIRKSFIASILGLITPSFPEPVALRTLMTSSESTDSE